jgi:PhoP regulatory network protein YrbL.
LHLARWYGMTETSIGIASETELIRNGDKIAETLETYLFREGITEEIKASIEDFEQWLKDHLVLTKNLIPHNLVLDYQNDKIVIKIIDGLGSQAFIPLPNYSDFFAKRYINRRIELMWSRIHWDLSDRKGNWK